MLYILASVFVTTTAMQIFNDPGLKEVTDGFTTDPHQILDSYMEKEEDVYNWYEIENSSIRSLNGGTIHYLNVTSQTWLDKSKAYGPNGGNVWSHHVAVNIPNNLTYTNISAAYITGDCNEAGDAVLPSATNEDILLAGPSDCFLVPLDTVFLAVCNPFLPVLVSGTTSFTGGKSISPLYSAITFSTVAASMFFQSWLSRSCCCSYEFSFFFFWAVLL